VRRKLSPERPQPKNSMAEAVTAAAQKQAAPPDTDIIKSPQDQRQYRCSIYDASFTLNVGHVKLYHEARCTAACLPLHASYTAAHILICVLTRRIVLANGLTALLISDPEMADAVAAADGQGDDAKGDGSDSKEVGSHIASRITS
jgi:hypothetical protein